MFVPKVWSGGRRGRCADTVGGVPRPPRAFEPGDIYHVIPTGNDGRRVFLDRADADRFLRGLDKVATEFGLEGYAYCLMPTHVHLVVRVGELGLSKPLQKLLGGFSLNANRRHGRSGHLFRNRFYAKNVTEEAHLYEACRYAVLNPVRAGLCGGPGDWPWSSYSATVGLERARPCLRLQLVLGLFGERLADAVAAYTRFVQAGHVPVSDTDTEVQRVRP